MDIYIYIYIYIITYIVAIKALYIIMYLTLAILSSFHIVLDSVKQTIVETNLLNLLLHFIFSMTETSIYF